MASRGSIAALMDTSTKRLQANITRLSEHMGVEPVALPDHNRDPELLMAYRLEALANWTDGLLGRMAGTELVDALDGEAPVLEDEDTEAAPAADSREDEADTKRSRAASDQDTAGKIDALKPKDKKAK